MITWKSEPPAIIMNSPKGAEDEVTCLVNNEIHAIDQMPLVRIVGAPKEIQARYRSSDQPGRCFLHDSLFAVPSRAFRCRKRLLHFAWNSRFGTDT